MEGDIKKCRCFFVLRRLFWFTFILWCGYCCLFNLLYYVIWVLYPSKILKETTRIPHYCSKQVWVVDPSCVVCPIICCFGKGLFLTLWLAQGVVVSWRITKLYFEIIQRKIDKSFRGVVTMLLFCFWRCSSLNVEKVFSALNDRLLEPVTEVQLVSWTLLQIHILIHWSIFGIYWSYQKKREPQIKPVPDVVYAQTFGAINLLHQNWKCYCSSVNKGL